MNDKLAKWLSRITQTPTEDDMDYEEYLEMLIESRILERSVS